MAEKKPRPLRGRGFVFFSVKVQNRTRGFRCFCRFLGSWEPFGNPDKQIAPAGRKQCILGLQQASF